jgi:hypothetical protein
VRARRDDRFDTLKRRVTDLARLDGEPVTLAEGLFLAKITRVTAERALVAHLRAEGVLDRSTLERSVKLAAPLVAVDSRTLGAAHRDVRILESRPALSKLREHRRAFAKLGRVDEAWLEAKRAHVDALRDRLGAHDEAGRRPKSAWFDGVVEIVRAMRGLREATLVAEAGARVRAHAALRRREASERVAVVARALATSRAPIEAELAEHAARLDAALDLPGRARRRRALDVLRRLIAWPSAPTALVAPLGAQSIDRAAWAERVGDVGQAMVTALPVVRDPAVREQSLLIIGQLALVFSIGHEGVPIPEEAEAEDLLQRIAEVTELQTAALPLSKALALWRIAMSRRDRQKIAKWVAEGLEIEHVASVAGRGHLSSLVQVPDVRAARAYATWAGRLSAHYQAQGISFSLSPALFASLPKNEDLAVLAMCLMEQVDPRTEGKPAPDPLAVLDATLALFKRLPVKARGILGNLRGTEGGEGRRLFPDFAEWLDDDALLDRYVHVARLASGGPATLSRAILEDFEHASRASGERAHLERLATRSIPQQGRLDALLRLENGGGERILAGSPRGRTRRRIGERLERLMPMAYRRELDVTFREILLEAWSIDVPSLTQAWRDAVRFWLVIDSNKDLLGRMLRLAAKTPGRDVKRAFPKNEAWIEGARQKCAVHAWLAPRRRVLEIDGDRFVLELEEDPLEVLRMGIPFGTCLALDGVNAASTVMNAVDANKRVLYVRNAAGRVVARKLLAISNAFELVGYNLYLSLGGKTQLAIRSAVLDACTALAADVGVPLASRGEPTQIHEGFWYDDGTVAFEGDVAVAAYCAHLGLETPTKSWEDLANEARAWDATERGDVTAALAPLATYGGPANAALGAWIVDRLGPRGAEKKLREDFTIFPPLAEKRLTDLREVISCEDGMVRVLELAARHPEAASRGPSTQLLARFPPSAKIAYGLVEMATRGIKRWPRRARAGPTEHGFAQRTMTELPAMFDDVAGAFDLLDAVEPAWREVERSSANGARIGALVRSANIIEAIFARAPDPDVVTATLMSRRRSEASHRAALRIAARHVLANGGRALGRFAALRPELAASPDGIAALVRQARADRVTDALARRAPKPSSSSAHVFEALRDLVLSCGDISRLMADSAVVTTDLDQWTPGPWELAWRRRRNDPDLADALFERAARAPRSASRAMELLALLGDLERIGSLDHVPPSGISAASPPSSTSKEKATVKLELTDPIACRRAAASLAEQVRATRRGEIVSALTVLPQVDAGYAELARQVLAGADDGHQRDAARAIVLQCTDSRVIDWHRLLAVAAGAGDVETAKRVLDRTWPSGTVFPPRLVVDLWQRPDARPSLASAIARFRRGDWSGRVWAAEREAAARGLSVEGLLEAIALALLPLGGHDEALDVDTLDQLRSVMSAVASQASPPDVALAYEEVPDAVSAALFVRTVGRLPLGRAAAVREAVTSKLDASIPKKLALVTWLGATRRGGEKTRR